MRQQNEPINIQALQQLLGGSLIWVSAAFLLIMGLAFSMVRVGTVTGEEVGILLHRLSGEIEVISNPGKIIYNGLLGDFSVLDRTLQTLEMTETVGRGERKGKDDLKVKTVDGSDVYVDLKVQYRIIPEMAAEIVKSSGLGDLYKRKWARDYVRSICRNHLGELTTEDFYDTGKRQLKTDAARHEVNERLRPFGIEISNILIPRRPHFYKEYEEMIKSKKLADQGVLEEQSKALAAKQKQKTMIVLETNKKNVAVEQFEGRMSQLIIAAKAQEERAKKQADAYYEKTTVSAGAGLYKMKKDASAILAQRSAEAAGITALTQALEGEGGRNMVMLEYARKLAGLSLDGQPFTIRGYTERFEHMNAPAASSRRK